MTQRKQDTKTLPFRGGVIKNQEPSLLPSGGFSSIQNMRARHPGFEKRLGCRALHTTADGTNEVMSVFQFSKGRVVERHTYAQMSDGDVLEATTAPPGVTTGAFGTEVHNGTASGMVPASWSVLDDRMVYSNGVDQHQIYPGSDQYVKKVVYVDAWSAVPTVVNLGTDYTEQATDGLSTTVIPLDSMNAVAGAKTVFSDGCSATTNWTPRESSEAAILASIAGGQAGNCLEVKSSTTSAAGAYYAATTIIGASYTVSYYFKRGTGATGLFRAGTGLVGAAAYDLYNGTGLSDADWTLHTATFTATTTTTYISVWNGSATAGETSLFDTILLTYAQYQYLYIKTDIPATGLKFTVSAANGDAAVAIIKYWNGAWTDASITDGTIASAGKTLGQTGSMTWTLKTDEYPYYMFDESGFWYQFSLSSGTLDAEVEISAIQYNTTWQGIQNVWDGIPIIPTEVSFYDQSATTYLTYSADSVSVGAMTSSDKVYVNSPDPLVGIYVDMGGTPNTTASTAVNYVYYWNGTAWVTVGTIYDGTAGLSKAGWIIFGRQSAVQPLQFNDSQSFSYWYYFTVNQTLSATLTASITLMPYYSISLFGSEGLCNCAWQDRMLYVFNRFPTDVVVSSKRNPMVLNGDDYTFLERPADGRANRIVCMKRAKNDLLVWQEERGVEGGSLTKYTYPSTLANIGKTVLSTHYGTFSAKSATVVEGIRMNVDQSTDEPITVAFFLSHYGVFMSDGSTLYCISDEANSSIQNYFDPGKTECIRTGYESKMWLSYDPAYHCLRLGLVSGSSATLPNIFPVYDIQDRAWSFDSLAQEFSCLTTVEAGSGNVTAVQVAGGIDDGLVYQSNYGANDVSTLIDAYVTEEIDDQGYFFKIDEVQLRMKVQSAGDCTVTPYLNGIAGTAKTLSMTADVATRAMRRHVATMDWVSDHISIKYQNATASQSIYLLDRGISLKRLEGQ